jgi:hypothetical protein
MHGQEDLQHQQAQVLSVLRKHAAALWHVLRQHDVLQILHEGIISSLISDWMLHSDGSVIGCYTELIDQ